MPSDPKKIEDAIDVLFDRRTSSGLRSHAAKLLHDSAATYRNRVALVLHISNIQVHELHQPFDREACEKLADCLLELTKQSSVIECAMKSCVSPAPNRA